MPKTAAVVGHLAGWVEGLQDGGVAVVPSTAESVPDLAVAPPREMDRATGLGAPMVLVEGRLGGRRGADYVVIRRGSRPVLMAPAGSARGLAYALRRLLAPAKRSTAVLAAAGARLARSRLLPHLGVIGEPAGPPAVIARAADVGVEPADRWVMWMRDGDPRHRGIVVTFADRDHTEPEAVLKFARRPESSDTVRADVAGLRLVATHGGPIASAAPRLLGTYAFDGHEVSAEEALDGTALTRVRASKAAATVDELVDLLIKTAVATRVPSADLEPERRRIGRDVATEWRAGGEWLSILEDVPGSFQHGDLWPANVICTTGGPRIVDWAHARACGLPFGDVVSLLTNSLVKVDGSDETALLTRLFTGRAPESAKLFHALEALRVALDLPHDAVGPQVTASILDAGTRARRSRERRATASGRPVAPYRAERLAQRWLRDPSLGPSWAAWRGQVAR